MRGEICDLELDYITLSFLVLFVGKEGFWEGRVGLRQGWFPSNAVVEMVSTGRKEI